MEYAYRCTRAVLRKMRIVWRLHCKVRRSITIAEERSSNDTVRNMEKLLYVWVISVGLILGFTG